MFAGADKNEEGKQNYSSYVELNYPFSIKSVDLNAVSYTHLIYSIVSVFSRYICRLCVNVWAISACWQRPL